MLLCIGDSLTRGTVGYSYIRYLKKKIKAVNQGVNGDTTRGALPRLRLCLRTPILSSAEACVVLIGTNDLLQPFLTHVSPMWWMWMTPRVKLRHCLTDDGAWAQAYEKYLKLLADRGIRTVLVSLPCIQLKGYPLDQVEARNAIIRRLAEKYGADFVDIYAMQTALVPPEHAAAYTWRWRWLQRVVDAAVMLLLPFTKDWFSKSRGLKLTVDGVHFNSLSARLLADGILHALAGERPEKTNE